MPEELFKLPKIQSIDLSKNKLTTLPDTITKLTNLQLLDLSKNELPTLPKSITDLANLKYLGLKDNLLENLPAVIANLTKLQSLYLTNNQLTTLPVAIGKLVNLSVLDISHNNLSTLPEIFADLNNLKALDISNNKLTFSTIIRIRENMNLKHNDQSSNMFNRYPSGKNFKKPPHELTNLGLDHIKAYFNAANEGIVTLREAKIIFVGNERVGKTSIAKRLKLGVYNKKEDSTHGVRIVPWSLNTNRNNKSEANKPVPVKLNLWDFGGQEIYHATHRFFMTYRALYILVWDCETEERIKLQSEEFLPYPYWLDMIRTLSNDSPVIMVQNKIDNKKCGIDNQNKLMQAYNIQEFLNVSAEKNTNIDTLKNQIYRHLVSHPKLSSVTGVEFPKSWQEIRTKLKKLKDEFDQHEIDKEDFLNLCSNYKIDTKTAEVLLDYMHVRGIFFFYTKSERLKDTIIIDPKWVLDRIYELLNNDLKSTENPGEFSIDRVHRKLERFSEDKRLNILELLQKFGLIFEKPSDSETFIAPQYLPEKPDQLIFNKLWDSKEDPILVYEYPKYVHRSIMVQFMSHFGKFAEPLNYWKNGIILREDGVRVLVKHPKNSKKITVTVEKKNFCPIHLLSSRST